MECASQYGQSRSLPAGDDFGRLSTGSSPSFNSWQLLSDTVEFPRAFMLRRMNHKNPLVDFDAP
jgi:hypothetical protein